jgi:hypothetical protein
VRQRGSGVRRNEQGDQQAKPSRWLELNYKLILDSEQEKMIMAFDGKINAIPLARRDRLPHASGKCRIKLVRRAVVR